MRNYSTISELLNKVIRPSLFFSSGVGWVAYRIRWMRNYEYYRMIKREILGLLLKLLAISLKKNCGLVWSMHINFF